MLWIMLLLAAGPARADSPHLPAEMQQKVDDLGAALRQGYAETQRKLQRADRNSGLVHSVTEEAAGLWASAKAKGRTAIVYLDKQLHEHVLGPDHDAPGDRSGQPPR